MRGERQQDAALMQVLAPDLLAKAALDGRDGVETADNSSQMLAAIAELAGDALEELDSAVEDFKSCAASATAARAPSPFASLQPIEAR